jgi:hypothetical protein
MFGLPEALMSFIRRQVGLRTDTADATGSLHAKIADLKEFAGTLQKPRGPISGGALFSTYSDQYLTALDLQGKGRLVTLQFHNTDKDGYAYLRLTIDGQLVTWGRSQANTAVWQGLLPSAFFITDGTGTIGEAIQTSPSSTIPGGIAILDLDFKQSLKIEIADSGGTAEVRYYYELE